MKSFTILFLILFCLANYAYAGFSSGVPRSNGAVATSSCLQSATRKGKTYRSQAYFTGVSNNDTRYVHIKTGVNPVETYFNLSADGNWLFEFNTGATITADGTSQIVRNYNGLSSNTSTTQFFASPTVTADGTTIATDFLIGGTGPFTSTGSAVEDTQTILMANTSYIIKATNKSGSTSVCQIILYFCEGSI